VAGDASGVRQGGSRLGWPNFSDLLVVFVRRSKSRVTGVGVRGRDTRAGVLCIRGWLYGCIRRIGSARERSSAAVEELARAFALACGRV